VADKSDQPKIARRQVLKGAAGIGGALAATGLGVLTGQRNHKIEELSQPIKANPSTPLLFTINLVTTMESLAIHFYKEVLSNSVFFIKDEDLNQLQHMMTVEMNHLSIWQKHGGISQAQRFQVPARAFSDAHTFVSTGMTLEAMFAQIYLSATQQLSALGQSELATTTAQHAASEAQHHTVLAHIAGLSVSQSQPMRPFARIEEAIPQLMSFIETGG